MQPVNPITDRLSTARQAPAPRTVLSLAYGGLLPFVALLAASLLDPARSAVWQDFSVRYGAVILSFVGALHWGFAMLSSTLDARQRNRSLLWSVMPALLAWLALALAPRAASVMLAAGFGLHYLQDWRLDQTADLPGWYLPLRLRLTLIATACLLLTVYAA